MQLSTKHQLGFVLQLDGLLNSDVPPLLDHLRKVALTAAHRLIRLTEDKAL